MQAMENRSNALKYYTPKQYHTVLRYSKWGLSTKWVDSRTWCETGALDYDRKGYRGTYQNSNVNNSFLGGRIQNENAGDDEKAADVRVNGTYLHFCAEYASNTKSNVQGEPRAEETY